MSRVHDALRRAEQMLENPAGETAQALVPQEEAELAERPLVREVPNYDIPSYPSGGGHGVIRTDQKIQDVDWRTFLGRCKVIPFAPAPETHLITNDRPHEVPSEEFRSLRTRLNHLQSQQ